MFFLHSTPGACQGTTTPDSNVAEIAITRQPGRQDGDMRISLRGKNVRVARRVVEGWIVRGGEGALAIILQSAKGNAEKRYSLIYYDLDNGRHRVLGTMPFSRGDLKETSNHQERWAFALTGNQLRDGVPVTIVSDDQAATGVLPGASSPKFAGDSLEYTNIHDGKHRSVPTADLLGTELAHHIFAPSQTTPSSPKYVQIFSSGRALLVQHDDTLRRGTWITDGEALEIKGKDANYSVRMSELAPVKGIPAETHFSVRMLDTLSSTTTHEGNTVRALLIEPLVLDGEILVPAGSTLEGKVVQANSVGWGFKHETASLTINWSRTILPAGRELAIPARVFEVENAQEEVKDNGKIQGIRSTGTPGHTAENGLLSVANFDPILYLFAASSGSGVLGFAEPEILYHAGTELVLTSTQPVITAQTYPPAVPPSITTAAQVGELQYFVRKLPFRTTTQGTNKVSDITNLVFVGSPEALRRAFSAAGWVATDELTPASTFRTVKAITGNETYRQAPMSVLLLDGRAPAFTLSKTTNTFAARHHVRIYPTQENFADQTVLTASSTQDIAIAFSSRQKTFIHAIDEHIDNERSKIVNDLELTGCVQSVDMVSRPWVPLDAYNSTGERLRTDGAAAVLRINACDRPATTPETPALPPNRFQRITRDTALTIRNDLFRGNVFYTGINGAIKLHNYLKSSSTLPENASAWRQTDAAGVVYTGLGENSEIESGPAWVPPPLTAADRASLQRMNESHRWDPPHYELWLEGGYMHMRQDFLSEVVIEQISSDPSKPTQYIGLGDDVGDGWAAGGSVTINSWKHFSNEFSYFRQQVKYRLFNVEASVNQAGENEDGTLEYANIGLVTRQWEYNLLAQLRPPSSRWRPYIAAGPVFQLLALNGAPLKKANGAFKLGLGNIGLIAAAFDFGNTPPLEGGGIFQFGLQYGGGIKYRATPRVMLRADFRETWSRNPDIISDSYKDYDSPDLDETYTATVYKVKQDSAFLQNRFTLGVGFTF